jgi:hypothetical protein
MKTTDEEIRAACARLVAAEGAQFESALRELKSALRGRFERLSNLAVATILRMPALAPEQEQTEIEDSETGKPRKLRYGT